MVTDRPVTRLAETIADAWRAAGGGTATYNPAAFAAALDQGALTADATCWPGCFQRPPHLCWFSAIGFAVSTARRKTPARELGTRSVNP